MSDADTTEKTAEPEKEWKPAGDRWKGWLKRFWRPRGVEADTRSRRRAAADEAGGWGADELMPRHFVGAQDTG